MISNSFFLTKKGLELLCFLGEGKGGVGGEVQGERD